VPAVISQNDVGRVSGLVHIERARKREEQRDVAKISYRRGDLCLELNRVANSWKEVREGINQTAGRENLGVLWDVESNRRCSCH
jgi:hypothetical protein